MTGGPNSEPLSITDARQQARTIAGVRKHAEDEWKEQIRKAAQAESDYRLQYAKALIQQEGTVPEKEAKAKEAVRDASYDRDLQRDLVRVSQERVKGIDGERALLRQLMEWSMRIETFLREER